jgi:hypothetical protein
MPSFGLTRQLGLRESSIIPLLDRDSSELYVGSIFELSLVVDIEKLPEETNSWLCLKVYFAEDLELTQICD